MATPKTAFDMAKRCAHLMGGNGLSTEQSILIIAHELANWKENREIVLLHGRLATRFKRELGTGGTSVVVFNESGADSVARQRGFPDATSYIAFLEELNKRNLPPA